MVARPTNSENDMIAKVRRRLDGELIPSQVILELTHTCNLRCRHCYLEFRHEERELGKADWMRVIDETVDLGVYFAGFTGGEVFMRSDFLEIARHARDRGIFFYIQTNGTFIDEYMADTVRELNPTKVEISLYGATAATHDFITALPGSFVKTLKAIELLRARDIRVPIKTTVMTHNCHEVAAIEKLARDFGTVCVPDPMVMPGAFGSRESDALRMTEEQFRKFMIDHGWHRGHPEEMCESVDDRDPVGRRLICSAARKNFVVSPGGEVLPCVLWRKSAGSVLEHSLASLWSGKVLSDIRKIDKKQLKKCTICSSVDSCVRCAANAYIDTGDATAPASESCRMSILLREVKKHG
ncbi:MAG: radical SAM protein [Thermoleophilia bacterium]|nr:radical SAM protein [Thermoleophilia bacterium]